MSGLIQVARNTVRSLWAHGDDEYGNEEEEDIDDLPTSAPGDSYMPAAPSYSHTTARTHTPSHGGGSGGHGGSGHSSGAPRRLRVVDAHSQLRRREKNIYTIKPKSQDDATIAADCLKTGDAVIVNLEELDRLNAMRIIDFMSGVCYGLENRGHAMKLGELIFLYTPGDFEIRSDEVDYGESEDPFFQEVQMFATPLQTGGALAGGAAASAPVNAGTSSGGVSPLGYTNPANLPIPQTVNGGAQGAYGDARRAWER